MFAESVRNGRLGCGRRKRSTGMSDRGVGRGLGARLGFFTVAINVFVAA